MNQNHRIDVSKIFSDVAPNAYFWIPAERRLWSNVSDAYMHGTVTGGIRRFTLKRAKQSRFAPVSVVVKENDLIRLAPEQPSVKPAAKVEVGKGYIIGTITVDGRMCFAPRPKIHTDLQAANAEMERLAKGFPGKTFVRAKIEAFAKANEVSWS
jgi:hypothetical protein